MPCEDNQLKSTILEYKSFLEEIKIDNLTQVDMDLLVCELSKHHDWTYHGAQEIVSLVNNYGAFMLRNALALAMALDKEDGELGF